MGREVEKMLMALCATFETEETKSKDEKLVDFSDLPRTGRVRLSNVAFVSKKIPRR